MLWQLDRFEVVIGNRKIDLWYIVASVPYYYPFVSTVVRIHNVFRKEHYTKILDHTHLLLVIFVVGRKQFQSSQHLAFAEGHLQKTANN